MNETRSMPLIGDAAPAFEAVTTQGKIKFSEDYKSKWVILFSHPADWREGDDVIVPTAGSCGVAKERMGSSDKDMYCPDWFLCFRKESKN